MNEDRNEKVTDIIIRFISYIASHTYITLDGRQGKISVEFVQDDRTIRMNN